MRKLHILFIYSFLIISCNNNKAVKTPVNKDSSGTTIVNSKPPQSVLNEEGTKTLMTLVTNYYLLKDALVATNAPKADSAAQNLIISTDSMQAFLKKSVSNKQLLKPYLDTITTESKDLVSVNDPGCEKKRAHFEKISDAMFEMLKKADLRNAHVYREYCPMALNEKGAFWLSDYTEIKNPYMGKKMIDCGDVSDSLK